MPGWGGPQHGFPETLYGYMMAVFAKIDLLSAFWRGDEKRLTERMSQFLDLYFPGTHTAHSLAVQVWRHKLMHTASPRILFGRDPGNKRTYRWLLHWRDHLPREQHWWLLETTTGECILNLALLYLVADIRAAAMQYLREMKTSVDLQRRHDAFAEEPSMYAFRGDV